MDAFRSIFKKNSDIHEKDDDGNNFEDDKDIDNMMNKYYNNSSGQQSTPIQNRSRNNNNNQSSYAAVDISPTNSHCSETSVSSSGSIRRRTNNTETISLSPPKMMMSHCGRQSDGLSTPSPLRGSSSPIRNRRIFQAGVPLAVPSLGVGNNNNNNRSQNMNMKRSNSGSRSNSVMNSTSSVLHRYKYYIPILMFIVFVTTTTQCLGIGANFTSTSSIRARIGKTLSAVKKKFKRKDIPRIVSRIAYDEFFLDYDDEDNRDLLPFELTFTPPSFDDDDHHHHDDSTNIDNSTTSTSTGEQFTGELHPMYSCHSFINTATNIGESANDDNNDNNLRSSNKLVFIHMLRTGGSFVKNVLEDYAKSCEASIASIIACADLSYESLTRKGLLWANEKSLGGKGAKCIIQYARNRNGSMIRQLKPPSNYKVNQNQKKQQQQQSQSQSQSQQESQNDAKPQEEEEEGSQQKQEEQQQEEGQQRRQLQQQDSSQSSLSLQRNQQSSLSSKKPKQQRGGRRKRQQGRRRQAQSMPQSYYFGTDFLINHEIDLITGHVPLGCDTQWTKKTTETKKLDDNDDNTNHDTTNVQYITFFRHPVHKFVSTVVYASEKSEQQGAQMTTTTETTPPKSRHLKKEEKETSSNSTTTINNDDSSTTSSSSSSNAADDDVVHHYVSMIKEKVNRDLHKGLYFEAYTRSMITPEQKAWMIQTEVYPTALERVNLALSNLVYKYNAMVGITEKMDESLQMIQYLIDSKNETPTISSTTTELLSDSTSTSKTNNNSIFDNERMKSNPNDNNSLTEMIVSKLQQEHHFYSKLENYLKYEFKIYDIALKMHNKQYQWVLSQQQQQQQKHKYHHQS